LYFLNDYRNVKAKKNKLIYVKEYKKLFFLLKNYHCSNARLYKKLKYNKDAIRKYLLPIIQSDDRFSLLEKLSYVYKKFKFN
jgi:hypothetical protein